MKKKLGRQGRGSINISPKKDIFKRRIDRRGSFERELKGIQNHPISIWGQASLRVAEIRKKSLRRAGWWAAQECKEQLGKEGYYQGWQQDGVSV